METTTVQVGLRRLYNPRGCGLAEGDEIRTDFNFPDSRVSLYLGPKPRFGISVTSGERYLTPPKTGEQVAVPMFRHQYGTVAESGYPATVCVELVAHRDVAVDNAFDAGAKESMLALAERERRDLGDRLDVVAGVVGIHFHRQFVMDEIENNEIPFAGSLQHPIFTLEGPAMERLERVTLNPVGVERLNLFARALSDIDPGALPWCASMLRWLLRAWGEQDSVWKFLALFIPLEAALQGIGGSPEPPQLETIRKLIRNHGGAESGDLANLLNRLAGQLRPSLEDRFRALAEAANLPGADADVRAVHEFNRKRNDLIHRASDRVMHRVVIDKTEVRTLEDIVERYVCYRAFGHAEVYRSRWRPVRSADTAATKTESDA